MPRTISLAWKSSIEAFFTSFVRSIGNYVRNFFININFFSEISVIYIVCQKLHEYTPVGSLLIEYKGGFSRDGCARQLCHSWEEAGAVKELQARWWLLRESRTVTTVGGSWSLGLLVFWVLKKDMYYQEGWSSNTTWRFLSSMLRVLDCGTDALRSVTL